MQDIVRGRLSGCRLDMGFVGGVGGLGGGATGHGHPGVVDGAYRRHSSAHITSIDTQFLALDQIHTGKESTCVHT